MSMRRQAIALMLMLMLGACRLDTIEHGAITSEDSDAASECGGTGGLCTVNCSDDLDCVAFSDDATCNEHGRCEAQSSCLGFEVCGDEARCSSSWRDCRPLGDRPLGSECVHAAQCSSGACAGICLAPCTLNRDCPPSEHCADPGRGQIYGYCQPSTSCSSCGGERQICDNPSGTCFDACRTTSDCAQGTCVAQWGEAYWTCSAEAALCPPDAFMFEGTCFIHDACDADDDCDAGLRCVALGPNLQGGYCSPDA